MKTSLIKDLAKYEKPREKVIKNGLFTLTNEELLAILIRTGGKDKSAIDVAREILKDIGDLRNLVDTEIEELTNKFANGLSRLGVRQGDHVASCLEGSVEVVVTRLAVHKLGCVLVPINNRLIGPEMEYILREKIPVLVTAQFRTVMLQGDQMIAA